MSTATGATAILAGKFESTYGTAATGDYELLDFVSSSFGLDQPLLDSDVLGRGREPHAPERDLVTVSGDIVLPVDLRNLGFWLRGLFASPTTTGSTGAYVHTFNSGADPLQSFSLEVGHPKIPRYHLATGVQVDKLRLGWSPGGRNSATVSLIGQGLTSSGSSGAGTTTSVAFQRFSQFTGTVKRGGVTLGNITAADLTLSNALSPARVVRSDGLIAETDPGVFAATGSITVRYSDAVLEGDASAGTSIALELGWAISASKSLTITLPEVYLPRGKSSISGPGGITVPYNFKAASPTGGHVATVVLKNDVASY